MQIVHQAKPVIPRDRLIRLPEVENLIGCKKSTVYMMVKQGTFPKPIRLSARMVAWPETSVLQWLQDRINPGEAGSIAPANSGSMATDVCKTTGVQ